MENGEINGQGKNFFLISQRPETTGPLSRSANLLSSLVEDQVLRYVTRFIHLLSGNALDHVVSRCIILYHSRTTLQWSLFALIVFFF